MPTTAEQQISKMKEVLTNFGNEDFWNYWKEMWTSPMDPVKAAQMALRDCEHAPENTKPLQEALKKFADAKSWEPNRKFWKANVPPTDLANEALTAYEQALSLETAPSGPRP